MQSFSKMGISFDVSSLKKKLEPSDMWGEYNQRCSGESPHREATDIWVRFNDPSECIKTGDWSSITDEHESIWLKDIQEVKGVCGALMEFVAGEQLGGVLITKLPPGGKIYAHKDAGWHAEYYDKYYIPIKNFEGSVFCFESGRIYPEEGDVYAFRNDVLHWVNNDSKEDRIAMIVCIKQAKFSKEGVCLGV